MVHKYQCWPESLSQDLTFGPTGCVCCCFVSSFLSFFYPCNLRQTNSCLAMCVCVSSLKNRPPQQSEHRQSGSGGYRSDYEQYQQQYQQQQQAYPGYYSSWGYDTHTPGAYPYNYQNYDYSQYTVPQVGGLHQQQRTFQVFKW